MTITKKTNVTEKSEKQMLKANVAVEGEREKRIQTIWESGITRR